MNILFEDWEAEQMQDPEFRAAVEELEPAYQAARRQVIDELPAGIELDISVAEALGYVRITPLTTRVIEGPVFMVVSGGSSIGGAEVYIKQATDDFTRFVPSTDIAAAWKVVQTMCHQEQTLRLTGPRIPDETGYLIEEKWSAAFVEAQYAFTDVGQDQGKGSTPSLAICRAALKVMTE